MKIKLKLVSKTQKMLRPQVWTTFHPNLLEDVDLTGNILCNLKKFGNRKKSLKNGEKTFYLNYQRKEMFLNVQTGEELNFFL
jgi:hypothetical protein